MKKWILLIIMAFSIAPAAQANDAEFQDEMIPIQTELEPMYKNCESRYLRNNESCWTSSKRCPPGFEGTANWCWSRSHGKFYRCGTTCDSIYRGD